VDLRAGLGRLGCARRRRCQALSANLETIDGAALSRYDPPLQRKLADDYAAINILNFTAGATRLTNSRLAVGWVLVLPPWGWRPGSGSRSRWRRLRIAPSVLLLSRDFGTQARGLSSARGACQLRVMAGPLLVAARTRSDRAAGITGC
jgi:hypothetical protein